MTIALVLLNPGDEAGFAEFIVDNALQNQQQINWRIQGEFSLAEQVLPALEAAFSRAPADMILFPATIEGDELATRLAWRLHGSAICQALSVDISTQTVRKAVYGNTLQATLSPDARPLCLSLSGEGQDKGAVLSAGIASMAIAVQPLPDGLTPPVVLSDERHPLQSASRVLATGQGACDEVFARLAQELKAEPAYSRQRVMAGGCDEQRMIGISGQRIAPEVCFVAGASGASAFMYGLCQSRLIVAINIDPAAPVFEAADVGIVGDAIEVLQALAQCARATAK